MERYTAKAGDVWRKDGPYDWIKVAGVLLPKEEGYDGGLPGVSVQFSTGNGGWKRQRFFWPCRDSAQFAADMANHGRRLA